MFLGHYGVAFAAKRLAPRTSIGTLTFAAQWLDELWPILLLAGVEHVRIVPGLMAASPMDFTNYPISHSLLLAIAWSVLIAVPYFFRRGYGRGAWIIAGLVVSHWVLDCLVHRPDLPLWPGGPRVGLGAWNSVPLTILLEGAFYGGGLLIYIRSTTARDRVGQWGLWAYVVLQVVLYAASSLGPPPPDVRTLALSALGLWLFIPWAGWVDRHREVRVVIGDS